MSDNNIFKVIMCAPSGVGKTTLIASIFEQMRDCFAGTPLDVETIGTTAGRIHEKIEEIDTSIKAGKFRPEAMRPTPQPSDYELDFRLTSQQNFWTTSFTGKKRDELKMNRRIRWAIRDYPGGWMMTSEGQQKLSKDELQQFEQWRNDSKVFIIPVEATLVYEAVTDEHESIRQHSLCISNTESMARSWAKERKTREENGIMMLVPVKCETYFADNGGNRNDGEKLYNKMIDLYKDVIEAVRKEAGKFVTIEYHPVDTFGCVILDPVSMEWKDKQFRAAYKVRPDQKFSPLGAANLLLSICRHAIEDRKGKGWSGLPILKWFDAQSEFLEEIEKVIEKESWFRLTGTSLFNLRQLNYEKTPSSLIDKLGGKLPSSIYRPPITSVPENIINRLEELRSKTYTRDDFVRALEKAIGAVDEKDSEEYKRLILQYSGKINKGTRVKEIN